MLYLVAVSLLLGSALIGQVDIDPAGELVARVPLTLAVAQQDKRGLSHGRKCLTRRGDQVAGSSSIRCSKAFRFFSDSPRATRQAHSIRMDESKQSSSRVLKSLLAASRT